MSADERLALDKSRCTKLCCCQVDGCSEDTVKACGNKTKACADKIEKGACDDKAACDSDKGVFAKASDASSRAGNKVSQTASKFMGKVTGGDKDDSKSKGEGLAAGPGDNPMPSQPLGPQFPAPSL